MTLAEAPPPVTVLLAAGEASGDALGADLAAALRRRLGDRVRFVGVGGARMAEQGVRSPFDMAELSVLGIVEGLKAYPRVRRRVADTVALAVRERPDVAVLIDSWGFTLRVAQGLRRALPGLPILKYVGPQVWASRPGRARTLARTVDRLLAITPMDAPLYAVTGLPVTFVGAPALARAAPGDGAAFRARHGLGKAPLLLVLPGSRPGEVARLAGPFHGAVARLAAARPELRVAVSVAETVAGEVRAWVAAWGRPPLMLETLEDRRDGMAAATAALACSGTVTTELALAGCPMVVGYRLGAVTHAVLSRLIRTPDIVLLNIAARRRVVPEHVQGDCTAERLAADLAPLLDDPAARAAQVRDQAQALDALGRGGPDPAEAAAEAVLEMVAAGARRRVDPPRP